MADLPQECWELIFNRVGHHSHLESLSLVCKRLLSITNSIRTSFRIVEPTILIHGTLSNLFDRFRSLTSIILRQFPGDLNWVLLEIAASDLKIETLDVSCNDSLPIEGLMRLGKKMRSLRVFSCSHMGTLRNADLATIAESMPCLEELDISHPRDVWHPFDEHGAPDILTPRETSVTDSGIERLSGKLRNLRKFDISGNHRLTDKSIMAISSNCIHLMNFKLHNCCLITTNGLQFLITNCAKLSSLSVEGFQFSPKIFPAEYSFSSARGLCSLHLYNLFVSDKFLRSVASAGFPLKKLTIAYCSKFSFSGLLFLLQTYRSLEYLALISVTFLDDLSMGDLAKCLIGVTTLKFNYCYNLTDSTLFMLAKNCPSLEDIEMQGEKVGKGSIANDPVISPQIKTLNLAGNADLTDECLVKVSFMCPQLELLDVSLCPGITEKGIAEILKNCGEIRHLNIDGCKGITSIGMGSKLDKLEVLQAAGSAINDEGLAKIGRTCCGLLSLKLEGCTGISGTGLMEVSRGCKRLKEINLDRCLGVGKESIDWIVFSRPSLRKIIPPDESFVTDSQRKLFLRHGCHLDKNPKEESL